MSRVTESIYNGSVIVPLADVQHIEPWPEHSVPGIHVIMKSTRWDCEHDVWGNSIWISDPEAVEFKKAWCRYRSELEADTLINLETGASLSLQDRAAGPSDLLMQAENMIAGWDRMYRLINPRTNFPEVFADLTENMEFRELEWLRRAVRNAKGAAMVAEQETKS